MNWTSPYDEPNGDWTQRSFSGGPPEELVDWLPEDGYENDEQENIKDDDSLEGINDSEVGC